MRTFVAFILVLGTVLACGSEGPAISPSSPVTTPAPGSAAAQSIPPTATSPIDEPTKVLPTERPASEPSPTY